MRGKMVMNNGGGNGFENKSGDSENTILRELEHFSSEMNPPLLHVFVDLGARRGKEGKGRLCLGQFYCWHDQMYELLLIQSVQSIFETQDGHSQEVHADIQMYGQAYHGASSSNCENFCRIIGQRLAEGRMVQV